MAEIELKINNKVQTISQDLGESFLISKGKGGYASDPEDIYIQLKMADDNKEVRGFGQPITPGLAKSITVDYIQKSDTAWDLITQIDNGEVSSIEQVKTNPGFAALKSLLNPEYHIVSGVFGKEIILQLISQKDCEGIRYIFGEMKDEEDGKIKMTVVLTGVRDVTEKGATKALSEPLAGWDHYKNETINSGIPPDTEVHKSSLTREQVMKEIKPQKINDSDKEDIAKILFGLY